MTTLTTTLTSLQQAALAALQADPTYQGMFSNNGKAIPIITEVRANIVQEIELALGQVGICALVVSPIIELHAPETEDLSGWAYLDVGIYEDAPINQVLAGTGISALTLCEVTVAILNWLPHGCFTGLVAAEPTAATKFLAMPRPIEFQSSGPPLQYNCTFKAHVTLNPHTS